jgi:hypothetical protein
MVETYRETTERVVAYLAWSAKLEEAAEQALLSPAGLDRLRAVLAEKP